MSAGAEAAARLREKAEYVRRLFPSEHNPVNGYFWTVECVFGDDYPGSLSEYFERLADLIDPTKE